MATSSGCLGSSGHVLRKNATYLISHCCFSQFQRKFTNTWWQKCYSVYFWQHNLRTVIVVSWSTNLVQIFFGDPLTFNFLLYQQINICGLEWNIFKTLNFLTGINVPINCSLIMFGDLIWYLFISHVKKTTKRKEEKKPYQIQLHVHKGENKTFS